MKRNGNTNTNRTYNPQNTKPPIPLDVDEVDAVLERFIRQKYDQQVFTSSNTRPARKNDTGSTRSSEDQPPPLPPKPGKRFGFGLRSASSALPLARNGPASPPRSPQAPNGWGDEPLRVNKQSRVFGTSVGGSNDNLETKLAQLRDMGFSDEKRNVNVLKGLGGNLERTIESLVRLEGSIPGSRDRTPNQPRNVAVSQPMTSFAQGAGATSGISFMNDVSVPKTDTGSTGHQSSQGSAPPSAPPQQQIATRSFSAANPYQSQHQTQPQPQSYNPFDPSHNQQASMASMNQAFSGMQVSQQPLFPNATGGYPVQPPPVQDGRLQTMTPPVLQMPHQYTPSNPYLQQQSQGINFNHNPFLRTTQQSTPASPNPWVSNAPATQFTSSYNPFQQTSGMSSPPISYSTGSPQTYSPQVQQGFFQQQPLQDPSTQQGIQQQARQDVFASQHSSTDPAQYAMQNQHLSQRSLNPHQPQPLQAQQTGRIDKTSILALYNYPHLAPPPLLSDTSTSTNVISDEQTNHSPPQNPTPQRSVTMPLQATSQSRNPFQSSMSTQSNPNAIPPSIGRHVSQESVDVGGFQSGRHSPDVFASLSARFVR